MSTFTLSSHISVHNAHFCHTWTFVKLEMLGCLLGNGCESVGSPGARYSLMASFPIPCLLQCIRKAPDLDPFLPICCIAETESLFKLYFV